MGELALEIVSVETGRGPVFLRDRKAASPQNQCQKFMCHMDVVTLMCPLAVINGA